MSPAAATRATEPAIGGGGAVAGRALAIRVAVVVACVLVLLGLKIVIAGTKPAASSLPPIRGAARVSAHLLRGGRPTDVDLLNMSRQNHVAAVVDVSGANIAERASTSYLGLRYLESPLPELGAPTLVQLVQVADFVRQTDTQGSTVYLHDDGGTGQAVTTTEMLLVLRGSSLAAVRAGRTAAEQGSLSAAEILALNQLAAALATPAQTTSMGNPYRGARRIAW